MATDIRFNPRRGTYYCQYWDGIWRRKNVSRKPATWKIGDPPPKIPPEAKIQIGKIAELEKRARLKTPARNMLPGSLDEFLRAHIETYKAGSKISVAGSVAVFLEWCAKKKITRIEQVDEAVTACWTEERSRVTEPATIRREKAQLARAWSKAVKRKMIADNPWGSVEVPKIIPKQRGSWTRAQFEKLLTHCRPWLKDILVVGVNCGLRISALTNLTWDDIEWGRAGKQGYGWIRVRADQDKVKKGYRVPISSECYDILSRLHVVHKRTHVLAGYGGRRIKNTDAVATAIRRACKRAKLNNPDSPNHHMRRTFGRWAVMGHLTGVPVPLTVVSRWMGHSTVKTTMIYLDVSDDDSTQYMLGTEYKPPSASPPS